MREAIIAIFRYFIECFQEAQTEIKIRKEWERITAEADIKQKTIEFILNNKKAIEKMVRENEEK